MIRHSSNVIFSLCSVISSCFEDGGGRFPFGHIRGKNLVGDSAALESLLEQESGIS